MKKFSLLLLLFACSREEPSPPRGAPALRTPPVEERAPPTFDHASATLVSDAFRMGRESARLEGKTEAAKEQLAELEMVVYFTDCIERRSGQSFKKAFDLGKHNDACRTETQKLTPAEIHEAAEKIMAKGKTP